MSGVVPFYVKTAYKDEPSFSNTKIITSLFTKSLKKDFGNNFKKCLEFKDANAQLLKNYNDVFDFEELGKMAIDYSDGIVTADKEVNETLLNYTKSKNLPLLEYPGEDYAEAYHQFYNLVDND